MPWWTVFVAPVIGGPIMWFLNRFDRRNTEQHAENKQILERIESKVERVDNRLDEHINWHLNQQPTVTRRRNKEAV